MPPLDIHPASDAERLAAFRNVHDVWSQGLPMEEHLSRRLSSVQHNRAKWVVGCVGNTVAASLGCYPLSFRVRGESVPGMAIGAVHTRADYRGRGFAPRLIQWVEDWQRQKGVKLGMLYSDLDPAYYAKMGYARCQSMEGCRTVNSQMAEYSASWLVRFSPGDHLPELAEHYASFEAGRGVSIERPNEYWKFLLQKHPDDDFYWLQREERLGYVALRASAEQIKVTDFALVGHEAAVEDSLYRAVLSFAANRFAPRVGGWLPDSAAAGELFPLRPRNEEITMLKPLDDSLDLDEAALVSAGWFREMDHV